MSHAHQLVESWDDNLAFALPSNDPNPLRVTSVISSSATAFADGEGEDADAAAFNDEDDFGFDLPERMDWARMSGSGEGSQADEMQSWVDGVDEEDDRSSTIKASSGGGTLKLPSGGMRTITSLDQAASLSLSLPTRPYSSSQGLSNKLSTVSLVKPFTLPSTLAAEDEDEDDFALPETLSHLSLRPLRNQPSSASFTSSTSTSVLNASWADTPSSTHSVPSLVKDGSEAATSSDICADDFLPEDDTFDDDDLDGIVLPDPLFFARSNSSLYLKTLLEAKSKSSAASVVPEKHAQRSSVASDRVRIASGRDTSLAAEETSFEAGLVLDDSTGGSHLLSAARLKTVKARTARARTLPLPKAARPKPDAAGPGSTALREKRAEEDWKKELERGWGRSKSPLMPTAAAAPSSSWHPKAGSDGPASSAESIGKGLPSVQARPSTSSARSLAPSVSPTATLRDKTSILREFPVACLPPPIPTPAASPERYRYPGSYAHGLLSRKASLPHLSPDTSSDGFRSPSPSSFGRARFAAPTASSLARKRERSERSPIVNQELFSPPAAATAAAAVARVGTPQLTFSPSTGAGSRLKLPTSSSRRKTRPPISHALFGASPTSASSSGSPATAHRLSVPVAQRAPALQTRPKGNRKYGDGTELDELEDLSVDAEKERLFRVPEKKIATVRAKDLNTIPSMAQILHARAPSPSAPPSAPRSRHGSTLTAGTASSELKRKKQVPVTSASPAALAADGVQRKLRKRPAIKIIKHLGGADQPKVQGKMRYNPRTFRWEGNEAALQAFEPALASARPALITHLTSNSTSSLGSFVPGSPQQSSAAKSAPAAISARVVNGMLFDPVKMTWVSLLDKDEQEPDPFADFDNDDDGADADMDHFAPGASGRPPSRSSRARRDLSYHSSSMDVNAIDPSPAPRPPVSIAEYIRRGPEEFDLARRSRQAEEDHRAEVAQWGLGLTAAGGSDWREKARGRLFDIRKVALRAGRDALPAAKATHNTSRSDSRPRHP